MAIGPVFRSADDTSADGSRDAIGAVAHADRKANAALAERTRAIAEAHDAVVGKHKPGSMPSLAERSFRAEIAVVLGVSERAAENLIGHAVALVGSLASTMDRFEQGELSYRHATALVDELGGLEPADLAALEAKLLSRAAELTPGRLRTVARMERERLHPETIAERHSAAADGRDVWLDDQRDGRSILSVDLASPTAHAIFTKLTTGAKQLKTPGDLRTLGNRRADLLAHILLAETDGEPFGFVPGVEDSDNFVTWFRGIRPTVIVTVPVLSLLGQSEEPATLDGVVPIDLQTARILAGNAPSFIRVLTHPETGVTLSVGRKLYKTPKDLKTYLLIRDLICRFPGCFQPAARSDLDHTEEWQYGGQTDHTNLAHLCRGHHMIKGETDWTVTQAKDGSGVLTWTTPSGRTRKTYPNEFIGGTFDQAVYDQWSRPAS
jgi:hypothetical protein